MFRSGGPISLLAILGCFVIKCNARHGMNQSYRDTSISCYDCNSWYDANCGDPFNPYTIGVVNCSTKRPPEHIDRKPTLCRKIIQRIEGKTRIIRSCGYIPDDRDDKQCVRKTGTHDVQVHYCACKHGLCNAGHLGNRPSRIILGAVVLAICGVMKNLA